LLRKSIEQFIGGEAPVFNGSLGTTKPVGNTTPPPEKATWEAAPEMEKKKRGATCWSIPKAIKAVTQTKKH